jgi:hypothetical protein
VEGDLKGVPRTVRYIQGVLALDAVLTVLGSWLVLRLLLPLLNWSPGLTGAARYSPAAGAQTHFSMLGSFSVGTPLLPIAYVAVVVVMSVALTVLAGRPSRRVGAALWVLAVVQAISLSLAGFALLALLTTPVSRRFYWTRPASGDLRGA